MLDKSEASKYMNLAIDVMKKTRTEQRDDGKVAPKVGAVLVMPDGTVSTACRGELREGDHAEYTLLERKNYNRLLENGTLFATLEPCAPGARKHPKLSCAERIFLARIATVYVGIEDPDPKVAGKGITYLRDRGIHVKMFDPEYQEIITSENKQFLEQALERKSNERNIAPVTQQVNQTFDESKLSGEALKKYAEKLHIDIDKDESGLKRLWEHFENIGLLYSNNGIRYMDDACIILFADNPRELLKQVLIKIEVEGIDDIRTIKEFDRPMVLVVSEIEEWYKHMPLVIDFGHAERIERHRLPFELLREALVNAIVHRDYSINNAFIRIRISVDKVQVESPGKPLEPITYDDVAAFRASSLSRNPKLAYVFNKMKLMEEMGFGLKMFKSASDKYKIPAPFFEYNQPYMTLTFPLSSKAIKSLRPELAVLSDLELQGFEYIRKQGAVGKSEYAQILKLEPKTAQRQLKNMKDLGLISDNGENPKSKNYKYIVSINQGQ